MSCSQPLRSHWQQCYARQHISGRLKTFLLFTLSRLLIPCFGARKKGRWKGLRMISFAGLRQAGDFGRFPLILVRTCGNGSGRRFLTDFNANQGKAAERTAARRDLATKLVMNRNCYKKPYAKCSDASGGMAEIRRTFLFIDSI